MENININVCKPICISYDPFAIEPRQCYFCNRMMTKKHYTFVYYNNDDLLKQNPLFFYAGPECGKIVFEITGQKPPQLTNLLKILTDDRQNNSNTEKNIIFKNNLDNKIKNTPSNMEGLLITKLFLLAGVKKGLAFTCALNLQFMQFPNKELTEKIAIRLNENAKPFCEVKNCSSIRDFLYNLHPDEHKEIELPILENLLSGKDVYI